MGLQVALRLSRRFRQRASGRIHQAMLRINSTPYLLLQLVLWWLVAAPVHGQDAPLPMADAEFSERVNARLKQVDELRDLGELEKGKVREWCQQAVSEMEAAARWAKKAEQFEALAAQAPREIEQTKSELANAVQATAAIPENATLPQIEQAISKRSAELERQRAALAEIEAELKGRAARRAKIPEQLGAARQRLAEIAEQLRAPAGDGEASQAHTARNMLSTARQRAVLREIASCEAELKAYEARTELLPLLHDLRARQVDAIEREIKQCQALVNDRRKQEAERQASQASREAGQAPSAVLDMVENNAKLAAMRKPLADDIVEITRRRELVNQKLSTVTEQHKRLRERFEAAGRADVASTLGLLLRKRRDELPNLRQIERDIRMQQQTQRDIQLRLLQYQDDRLALANLDQRTQAKLDELDRSGQIVHRAELDAAIRDALKTESEYLDALIADYSAYYDKLVDLIGVEMQLIEEIEDCARFIDQRVLWIASASPLGSADLRAAGDAVGWLLGPAAWLDVGGTLTADALRNKTLWTVTLCLFAALFYWRFHGRVLVREIGQQAARGGCYRLWPTLEVSVLTTLLSMLWPGLMAFVAWRLAAAPDASDRCRALSEALTLTARALFALELLRHIGCGQGLGEAHFGWSAAALKLIRQNLRWFSAPALLLMCGAVTLAWQNNDAWDTSLGRMCFIAALGCFSLALHRVLRPTGAVMQAMIASRQGGWLERFRYVWYGLSAWTPAALALLAAFGYHYTARQLALRLIATAYVLVGGIVCRALLLRWTLVNQRKLAIEQARQRRMAAQAANNAPDEASESDLPTANEPERDLAAINAQTRRLIEYAVGVACALGVWCAWVDVLPALSSVNVKMWATQLHDVTLADLLLVLIIFFTTAIAAKNIPGLLEMAVLQHLPLDAGARYAVATVCRYVITLIGAVWGCHVLGLGWLNVQWLVAAMGLGLGFGLQEIFANFVSGLIILCERPIRVGDIVTIDDVSGVVSRIRMRATTITDWDRKELIIPNKDFITGRVLNWTLSDPVNRVVVKVGVAYGSDTERVAEILSSIAKNHPHVLDEPAPVVTFESFGDSALNFVLRCFLPSLENRVAVIHQLHMSIDRAFRAAGIEIAFPQHDIHVRSIDLPLPILQTASDRLVWPAADRSNPADKAA